MGLIRRLLAGALGLALAGLLFFGGLNLGAQWLRDKAADPGPLAAPKVMMIERGASTGVIARQLEAEGAITDRRLFLAAIWLADPGPVLKAGEYELPAAASINDLITLFATGKVLLHRLTVPEGLTTAEVLGLVADAPALAGAITAKPAEGSLLPETYSFPRGLTRDALVEKMAADRAKLLADLWAGRAGGLRLKTPEEAVTLASIVEKETGLPAERPRVAAVFLNRLARGMPLQADPTVVYGLTMGKGPLGRDLSRADLQTKHAWNTYVIPGLPPGPIANPGRASLAAVLNPPETKELYFVADGTGGHAFAETLAQHNANVARWRKLNP